MTISTSGTVAITASATFQWTTEPAGHARPGIQGAQSADGSTLCVCTYICQVSTVSNILTMSTVSSV